jgi:hypothetical protein
MSGLFVFLLLVSIACFVLGILKPSLFNKLFKGNASRAKISLAFVCAFIILSVLIVITSPKNSPTVETPVTTPASSQTTVSSNQPVQQVPTSTKAATKPPTTQPTVVKPPSQSPTQTKLKITASIQGHSVTLSSGDNYTTCNDSLTVITVDQNQQPVFTAYKDIGGSINLFTGDQHSIAYGSLTDSVGDTLSGDVASGKFENNAAGIWNLTCDQGAYELKINTIQ